MNPHGPYLLYNSYALSQNPNIPTMEEWKPLPLQSAVHAVFFGSVLLLAVLLRLSPRRFTPAQVLLLARFRLAVGGARPHGGVVDHGLRLGGRAAPARAVRFRPTALAG